MTIRIISHLYKGRETGNRAPRVLQSMKFGIIGTSIWQQNMPLLELLTIDRDRRSEDLASLKGILGVDELVYLATCNRVEFMYASSSNHPAQHFLHKLIDFFCRTRRGISFFPNDFYHYTGREAIVHLFRTASSLESLVIGETQITGQLKEAFQRASDSGLSGPVTSSLISEALQTARRVKRETNLQTGALSMASLAANELAAQLQGRKHPIIALVGAGPMTSKLAKSISDRNLGSILFVNRTVEKAEALAGEFKGRAMSFTEFSMAPGRIDAIISATSATDAVFDAAFLTCISDQGKPVVCIDLAVPRDFSLEFAHDPKVLLVDIPYLKARGNGNLRKKFVEAGKANDIVRDAVGKYLSDRVELSLKPIFASSYKESMELADQALEDLFERRLMSLGDEEKAEVRRLVGKLIGHSSFQPVKMLSDRLVEMNHEMMATEFHVARKAAL